MTNPLVSDREVAFLLYEVLDVERLCALEHFADHSRETFDAVLQTSRRLAREVLFPAYRAMDEEPPELGPSGVTVHPAMKELLPRLADLGILAAHRPYEVGGMQLPLAVSMAAQAYLMAANLSAYGYVGLTSGAAHLIEAFGDEHLRTTFMPHLYAGEWTGTMALTEPDAGSSLGDLTTTATPRDDGTYALRGGKIFISGGDHDLTENILHMTLARIEGAPAGTRGISLFAVPKRRPAPDGGGLVDNDLHVAGIIHKIGWRGLPSLVMSYGEADDCLGWLVGEPGQGLRMMFQMMNEARLMVGLNGVATASAAYHEAVAYARERPQGRDAGTKDGPQVPIIEHADVRRMLLRQKAIVDGGLTLLGAAAVQADLAEHAADPDDRRRAQLLLDLLTPMAKTFPAEAGFESNALAVQVHGGYGYTSEYLPESWLRDQKLNSIHEGTTGIQGLDLLGRRAMADGGAALAVFVAATEGTAGRARDAGVRTELADALAEAVQDVVALTGELGLRGTEGDVEGMLRHSADYLDAFSTLVVAWQHLERAAAAAESLAAEGGDEGFYRGVEAAADYWFATELPRVALLTRRIRSCEDSYARMRPDWF